MLIKLNIKNICKSVAEERPVVTSCFIRNFSVVYEIFLHFVLFSCSLMLLQV